MPPLSPSPDVEVIGLDPDPLHALAYVSTPTTPFTDADVVQLLLSARRWNAHYGVTGKLVVLEDAGRIVRFAQWVEGPEVALAACAERIARDPRHGQIEVQFQGPVRDRRFPSWDMAIAEVTPASFDTEVGGLFIPEE